MAAMLANATRIRCTYNGKAREGKVEKVAASYITILCELSGGYRNFSFSGITDLEVLA
jgi:hypothetical protein